MEGGKSTNNCEMSYVHCPFTIPDDVMPSVSVRKGQKCLFTYHTSLWRQVAPRFRVSAHRRNIRVGIFGGEIRHHTEDLADSAPMVWLHRIFRTHSIPSHGRTSSKYAKKTVQLGMQTEDSVRIFRPWARRLTYCLLPTWAPCAAE